MKRHLLAGKTNIGSHFYPGCECEEIFTSNCEYGCGCWMGPFRSGGPDGLNPFGDCPAREILMEEKNKKWIETNQGHGI